MGIAKKSDSAFYNKSSWNIYVYVKERIIIFFLEQRETALRFKG